MGFEGSILAIDAATRTGTCEGVPGRLPRLSTENFRQAPADGPEEIFARATFWLADRLRENPPTLVAIEQPVPPSAAWGATNHQTTIITIGLYGIFVGIARCKSIQVLHAPINSWRRYFLGKGNLKGDVAKRQAVALCRHLGWDAPDHNAAEAAGIYSWACSQIAPALAPRIEPLFAQASRELRRAG